MKKITYLIALVAVFFTTQTAQAEYKFKVKNTTDSRMTKLMVSEDGKKWGQFDIGKGIAAGASAEMVWDSSTDDGECEQKVKAAYADGSESEVAEFDFCEADLELEF